MKFTHQLQQIAQFGTDSRVIWYFLTPPLTLSTVLDDFSLSNQIKIKHTPRLLSDNGPSYISSELAHYLENQNMAHARGKPYHPKTQGKIECWHRSLKNQSY